MKEYYTVHQTGGPSNVWTFWPTGILVRRVYKLHQTCKYGIFWKGNGLRIKLLPFLSKSKQSRLRYGNKQLINMWFVYLPTKQPESLSDYIYRFIYRSISEVFESKTKPNAFHCRQSTCICCTMQYHERVMRAGSATGIHNAYTMHTQRD